MRKNDVGSFWQMICFITPKIITRQVCKKYGHAVGPVWDMWYECAVCGATDSSGELKMDYDKFKLENFN